MALGVSCACLKPTSTIRPGDPNVLKLGDEVGWVKQQLNARNVPFEDYADDSFYEGVDRYLQVQVRPRTQSYPLQIWFVDEGSGSLRLKEMYWHKSWEHDRKTPKSFQKNDYEHLEHIPYDAFQ